MHPFAPLRRSKRFELADDETRSYEEVRAFLKDIQRANRLLGGTAVVMEQVPRWLRSEPSSRTITFLDIATGSADIPRAIVDHATRKSYDVAVIGLDLNNHMLRLAREETRRIPQVSLIRGDAFSLPFSNASVDYLLCSLSFHHFGPDNCVRVLQEMDRIARRGWLVNDLQRSRLAWFLAVLASRVGGHRITRYDVPLSVLRAYTVEEYRDMIAKAGIPGSVELRRRFPYRIALVRDKEATGADGEGVRP